LAKINIQFHSKPEETIKFVKECIQEFKLYVVTMRFKSEFKATFIDTTNEIENEFHRGIRSIFFLFNKPSMPIKNERNFLTENPGSLLIEIGEQSEKGLNESCLSAMTGDAVLLKYWKKIVNKLKKTTFAGVWAVNPHTSAKSYFKAHRYTSGAKELGDNGINMLPAGGWNLYKFSDPERSTGRT
jgi:hypothetical protein